MTKSTITRERIEQYANDPRMCNINDEIRELARMALAAMDSEPVAEVYQAPNVGICAALGPSIRMLCPLEPGTKLYRHAQPALVVPDEIKHRIGGLDWGWEGEFNRGWNACRAAMLQAEPVRTCPSGDGSLRWPCQVHPGSSPVIPDGYVMVPVEPNGDMLAAAQDAYGETDGDIASTLRAAMLAAAPQEVR
ncbi:TPA: hypothetical protein MNC12_004693 [Klebsiella pneumoniae]|nr:hypothetical protein [Klebsiella pneumoniae]HBW4729161.1 hypothetical protein [Klebsiella pneumoniae]HBW4801500.1 hypothetical protein [Klebsiella pneumoniae]HBW5545721.1 hypothetical protein [Klebsiella pneumoniae]HBW5818029.1 hypothetical protein [Klebsiella pneumoniae]